MGNIDVGTDKNNCSEDYNPEEPHLKILVENSPVAGADFIMNQKVSAAHEHEEDHGVFHQPAVSEITEVGDRGIVGRKTTGRNQGHGVVEGIKKCHSLKVEENEG